MSALFPQSSHVTNPGQVWTTSPRTNTNDVELGPMSHLHDSTYFLYRSILHAKAAHSHPSLCARAPLSTSLSTTLGSTTSRDLSLEAQSRKDKGYVVAGIFPKHGGVMPTERIVWVKGTGDLFQALRAEEKYLRSFWRRWLGLKEVTGMEIYKVSSSQSIPPT